MPRSNRPPINDALTAYLRALSGANTSQATIRAYETDLMQFLSYLRETNCTICTPANIGCSCSDLDRGDAAEGLVLLAPARTESEPVFGKQTPKHWQGYASWIAESGLIPGDLDPRVALTASLLPGLGMTAALPPQGGSKPSHRVEERLLRGVCREPRAVASTGDADPPHAKSGVGKLSTTTRRHSHCAPASTHSTSRHEVTGALPSSKEAGVAQGAARARRTLS